MIHMTEETIVEDVPKVINIIGTVCLFSGIKFSMTSRNVRVYNMNSYTVCIC